MPAKRTKSTSAVAPGTPTSEASSRRSLSIRRRADDRAPLSDLAVNDDEAERQSRRKSGNAIAFAERSKRRTSGLRKQVEDNDDAADTPDDDDDSYGATKVGDKKRKKAAGVALDGSTGGPESRNNSTRTKKARLSVVSRQQGQNSMIVPVHGAGDKAAVPQVSMEIMSSNFEEWMKMATDNKITANNTWGFALIDYFADLTLLRNGPNDASINFQKASCTLDGCVKVWTSRVDSVATETGKLLSGLADDMAGDQGADSDAHEEGEGEEDGDEGAKKTRKRAQGNQPTLAKSFDALKIKKFDLEFTVDPLFKKTSADFDEGGAQGLLMNHLSIDGKGRVVFDSGDVEVDEEEEEDAANEEMEAPEEMVDLDKLQELLPPFEDIAQRTISVTLADFKFTSDPNEAFSLAALTGMNRDDDEESVGTPAPAFGNGDEEDFFGGGNDLNDHDQGGGDYEGFFGDNAQEDGDGDGHAENTSGLQNSGNANSRVVYGPAVPFDPSKSTGSTGLVMAKDDGDSMMLDYFDQGFLKNWAGPEHWKLRRAVRRVEPAENATVAKNTRKEKTPFLIDFDNAESPSAKELFASSKAAITIPTGAKRTRAATPPKGKKGRKPKASKEESDVRDEHLLPDDMHFSSRQLLRLFMKPKFTLKMRRRIEMSEITQDDGEVDENFWASAAAAREQGDPDGDLGENQPNGYDGQFFHDDVDDAADFAEVDDGLLGETPAEGDEDDLWAGAQGLKKAKPETVNYAKRAKRVDVKRLKDNIWKGLKIPSTPSKDEAEETETHDEPEYTPGEERTFSSVIENLRDSYSNDKMSEISTSFCFICLLHLANEQGLEIEPARFDDGRNAVGVIGEAEGVEASGGRGLGANIDTRNDRVVGELQALKIRKDPDVNEVE